MEATSNPSWGFFGVVSLWHKRAGNKTMNLSTNQSTAWIILDQWECGVTYRRSGPVEADGAGYDPLVRGEGRQEEISFRLSFADSQSDSLEKVVDAERQDDEKSSGSGLNGTVAE